MGRPRVSIRSLMVVVAALGFDAAAMTRAVQQGRAVHSVAEYAAGFGLVLLALNVAVLGLLSVLSREGDGPGRGRLNMTPSPLMIAGFYVAILAVAILSVLFLSSRPF